MRKFRNEGHDVTIITPSERRLKEKTGIREQSLVKILKVRTLNIQKTNFIEKGLGTILIEHQLKKALQIHLKDKKFDLVLYSTPPITLTKIVSEVKKKHNAKSYLLLKDIFPQNAVDLGILKKNGFLYKYFRSQEKKLYKISDFIGTMSSANISYLLTHNQELDPEKVEVCPNSIELTDERINQDQKISIRNKYNIPYNCTTFIYGGNLGKPQGLDFMIEVLESNYNSKIAYFVVIGTGTEYKKIEKWFKNTHPVNASLFKWLPKDEFDRVVQSCDIGMIFLDKRFTIPNYPSRLLNYLEYKMPVIVVTDPYTDIGEIAEKNGYGLWSISGDLENTNRNIKELAHNPELAHKMGDSGYNFLRDNFTVDRSYRIIMSHFSIT